MSKRRVSASLRLGLLVVALLVVGILFWVWARTKSSPAPDESAAPTPTVSSQLTPSSAGGTPAASPTPSAAPVVSADAQTNMKTLSRVLFDFSRPGRDLKELIQYLQSSGQEPTIARDKNDVTGELLFVRTKSPLPGTRYFHAQYFSDGGPERFLQHMSFEVPGGPQAMTEALDAVRSAFPGLSQPNIQTEGLVSWDAGDGYTVWVKRLGEQELLDNPFNAYTKNDVGTVRIAIEATPESE